MPTSGVPAAQSIPRIPRSHIREEVLPNGARIIVDPRPGDATVSLDIATRAGSMQDLPGKEGAAHLFEHMAFEGTGVRSHEDIFRTMQRQGGAGNAATGQSDIQFTTTVPANQAARAVSMFADIYRHPNSGRYNLAREKRIVEQEMRSSYGSKDGQATLEHLRLLYGDSPYGRAPIGSVESVESIKPSDVRTFASTYMTGANTVALVSGDPKALPLKELRKQLSQLPVGEKAVDPVFTGFRSGSLVELIPHSGAAQASLVMTLPNLSQLESFMKATGGISIPTGVVGELVGRIVSDKVNTLLREKARYTYGASAGKNGGSDSGEFLTVETDVAPVNLKDTVTRVTKLLRGLPKSITAADVERARTGLVNEYAMMASQPGAQAQMRLEGRLDGEGSSSPQAIIRALKSIETSTVRDASTLFVGDLSQVRVMATGAVSGRYDDIAEGLAKGGVSAPIKRVPFARSRYAKMLDTPSGPLKS